MDRIASRRHAANLLRQAQVYQSERMKITDPLFNVREILKQMVLLEDHLLHEYKLCPDCIRKHLLTVEAFAEEGVSLAGDSDPAGSRILSSMAENARRWMQLFHDQNPEFPSSALASEIRRLRKILTPLACDPRVTAKRIASLYLERQKPHRH
jgi:hypothetical protein